MKRTGLLTTAENIVHEERGHYASPDIDFARTADLLNALGYRRKYSYGDTVYLTAQDIGFIMICVKLSRLIHEIDPDGLVDIAGYVECIGIIQDIHPEEG